MIFVSDLDKWQFCFILRRLNFKYSSIWREMFFFVFTLYCVGVSLRTIHYILITLCVHIIVSIIFFFTLYMRYEGSSLPLFKSLSYNLGDYSAKSPRIFIWSMTIPCILSLVSLIKWHFMPQVLFNLIFNQWNLTFHYITNW